MRSRPSYCTTTSASTATAIRVGSPARPFRWNSFVDFLAALAVVAPQDYHPETHRFRFDLKRTDAQGRRLGYCQDAMRVKLTPSAGKMRKGEGRCDVPIHATQPALTGG